MMNPDIKRFNHLTSEINSAYHNAALRLGISDSAMQIFYTICSNNEPCLISDICRLTGISKQTINSALRKLESENLVYLELYNGKNKCVKLTETGKIAAGKTAMKIIEIENRIFDMWSEEKKNLYLSLTQEFLDGLRQEIENL